MRAVIAVLVAAALAGCANDPYRMRDYATVIEQMGKVGTGPASPSANPPKEAPADESRKPPSK